MSMNAKEFDLSLRGGKVSSLLAHPRAALAACVVSVLLCSNLFAQDGSTRAQDGASLETWLQQTEEALTNVESYTAVFHRIERVEGKLIPEEVTILKFKRPFKVYMKWIKPFKDQESLYAAGANHNKIRAHGSGLKGLVTVNLDPTGTLAMENSRHPITEAGLHNLVGKIASNIQRACAQANSPRKITANKRFMVGKPGNWKAFCRRIPRRATTATGTS